MRKVIGPHERAQIIRDRRTMAVTRRQQLFGNDIVAIMKAEAADRNRRSQAIDEWKTKVGIPLGSDRQLSQTEWRAFAASPQNTAYKGSPEYRAKRALRTGRWPSDSGP